MLFIIYISLFILLLKDTTFLNILEGFDSSSYLPLTKVSYPNNRKYVKRHKKTGDNLFSQQGNPQISSAHWSLTSVFGMGTGISSMS